ncbi:MULTISPECIES: helix-turn-helix domain-containing protein [Bacillus cereus group]|uniref:Transcriptional regulator n=1 Tax=Bacillus cereus TaxID=1396 RepID=A0AA44Q5L0_BACCE|nr:MULTISPECIES: helix-turn-helix domain-containing protein [Bacillus cereus group]EEL50462.1 transcriptional regulator/TPR domain protein [Bacillus cereus Rock3-44]PFA16683.1 transcriptional regulator [Bacillus cereus]PFN09367.1 transcriptional regulator [Bacillus cereus]PFO78940.1 transcriptional regulator [Bacillus cereus]PFR30657.1 transcriptional regulator [Bacillus cereus]
MQIGERIRQIRIHKGMTQGELVSGICSVAYLSRIENGQIKPSSSFLKKVSQKLNVDWDFLIDGKNEGIESNILKICERYKKDKRIAETELSSLELYVRDTDSMPLLLKIYGVIIYYHARNNNLLYVAPLVDQASQVITNQVEAQDTGDYIYYLMAKGAYFFNKGDYVTAYEIYKKIENLLGPEETVQHASIYYNISHVRQNLDKDQSISRMYAKKAYKLYEKFNDEQKKINVLILLTMQYNKDKLPEQAIESLKQAENEAKTNNNPLNVCLIAYNYGKIYQGLKDYANAIPYYEKSLELSDYLTRTADKVYILRNLIEIHMERKEWQTVNELIDDAFNILATCDIPYAHVQLYGFKAQISKLRGNDDSFEKNMEKAIEIGLEKRQYSLVRELALELGNYLYDSRAYKRSAKYFKIAAENVLN